MTIVDCVQIILCCVAASTFQDFQEEFVTPLGKILGIILLQ